MPLKPSAPPMSLAWSIWSLGALLYLMAFFHRVAPAVMTRELMLEFNISGAALGNLSALYFYSYVGMQIPTGVFADTWGPRRLLSAGAWVAGIGTILFALAPALFWAGMGRFLIGGSVAVAFVGMLKLSTCWFAPRHYAMISGLVLFCGIIGAVAAGPPLRFLLNHYSWRSVMLVVAALTFAIGFAIRLFVRDFPHQKGYANPAACQLNPPGSRGQVLRRIQEVLRVRNTLLLLLIPNSLAGANLTFSGLWGVPYLTTHYDLTRSQASFLATTLLVAMALGGPVIGWLSDRIGRRKPLYITGCAAALAGWVFIFFVPNLPWVVLAGTFVIIGFSSGCMVLTFALGKESVPADLSGTISGVLNAGVMIGPMLLQPAVGWMLDRHWQGAMQSGVRLYSLQAYQAGFCLVIGWMAMALVLLFFTRETYCRQKQ